MSNDLPLVPSDKTNLQAVEWLLNKGVIKVPPSFSPEAGIDRMFHTRNGDDHLYLHLRFVGYRHTGIPTDMDYHSPYMSEGFIEWRGHEKALNVATHNDVPMFIDRTGVLWAVGTPTYASGKRTEMLGLGSRYNFTANHTYILALDRDFLYIENKPRVGMSISNTPLRLVLTKAVVNIIDTGMRPS